MAKTPLNNKSTGRKYAGDKKYQAKPEQKKRRALRNKARADMIKEGRAKKGDGKDVMHKNGNPNDGKLSNLKSGSKAKNRSYKRTKGAGKKNASD